jgi:hypothetical protein
MEEHQIYCQSLAEVHADWNSIHQTQRLMLEWQMEALRTDCQPLGVVLGDLQHEEHEEPQEQQVEHFQFGVEHQTNRESPVAQLRRHPRLLEVAHED